MHHTSLYFSICNATHPVSEAQCLIFYNMIGPKVLYVSAKEHRYMSFKVTGVSRFCPVQSTFAKNRFLTNAHDEVLRPSKHSLVRHLIFEMDM